MTARIFISYSRNDIACAQRLATALANLGADVWWDVEDIPPGVKWSRAIQEGLDAAEVMLVILSPESMDSTNVEDEWQYFLDHHKPVIPILWEPCKIHFQLNRIQYIDFHHQDFDTALRQLHAKLSEQGVQLKPMPAVVHAMPPVMTAGASPIDPSPGTIRRLDTTQVMPLVIGTAAILLIIAVIAGVFASGIFSDDKEPASATEEARDRLDEFALIARGEVLLAALRDADSATAAEQVCPEFDVQADDFWNEASIQSIECREKNGGERLTCTFTANTARYERELPVNEHGEICGVTSTEVLSVDSEDAIVRGAALVRAIQYGSHAVLSDLICSEYRSEVEASPLQGQPIQTIFCHRGDSPDRIGCSFWLPNRGTTYYVTFIVDSDQRICGDEGIADEQGNGLEP